MDSSVKEQIKDNKFKYNEITDDMLDHILNDLKEEEYKEVGREFIFHTNNIEAIKEFDKAIKEAAKEYIKDDD